MIWRAALFSAFVLGASPIHAAGADAAMAASIGKRLFKRAWMPAPSSTHVNDGLGPLFNARACLSCHQGLDRMAPQFDNEKLTSEHIVIRLSDEHGNPDPIYGEQLQSSAIQGHQPEGYVILRDGDLVPAGLNFGPLAMTTRAGGRDAPMLRGLGQLENVPDSAILALAEQQANNADGVKGRANILPDGRLGRFGWKATMPSISEQVAIAFHLDLGMSTSLYPAPEGDCTAFQVQCKAGPHGGSDAVPEIHDEIIAMLSAYLASVEPPKAAEKKQQGERLFASTGCATCHQPQLPTRSGATIQPFTDLLLHDLGPELDGGATAKGVKSTEWRTAPLWGLSRTILAGGRFLHDGRAANVESAISYHGGEAAASRRKFHELDAADRQHLLDYLESL